LYYPARIAAQGFRSIVRVNKILLPSVGLCLIKGFNTNTGGSSGAGKSSINLILSYALGFCPFPATELASWESLNPPPMLVEVAFEGTDSEIPFTLTRGPGICRVDCQGESFTGKKAEEFLDTTFKVSRSILQALTYRAQGDSGLFLRRTDAEKRELLAEFLPLGIYETASEEATKRISTLSSLYQYQDKTCLELAEKIQQSNRLDLITKDRGPHLAKVEEAKRALEEATAGLDASIGTLTGPTEKEKQLLAKLELCKGHLKTIDFDDRAAKASLRQELEALQSERSLAMQSKTRIVGLRNTRDRIAAQVASLKANTCPTCEREWVENAKALGEKEAELHFIGLEIERVLEEAETVDRLDAEISSKREKINTPDPVAVRLTEGKAKLEDLIEGERRRNAGAADLMLKPHRVAVREARGGLDAATSALSEFDKEQSATTARRAERETLSGMYKKAVAELEGTKRNLALEQDFLALVGKEGYLGAIFDETLEKIAEETNDILSAVSVTEHISIRLVSEVVGAKKTTKTIKAIVMADGVEIPLRSGLSGGMISVLDLAVDLAIGKVIGSEMGVSLGWLALDESFNGIDLPCKRACMEILKQSGKLVLVVDHANEFQSAFDIVLGIEYSGRESTIKEIVQ
jgi:DNA repair exonuclease SbcCD ATPase subunit